MLVEHMRMYPWLSETFRRSRNSPLALMAKLQQDAERTSISRDELIQIARTKVAGVGGVDQIKAWIEEYTDDDIRQRSSKAFTAPSSGEAVRTLSDIKGVGVPVASAVLAWCFPDKWAVIDRRSWNTLVNYECLPGSNKIDPKSPKKFLPEDYAFYMDQVLQLRKTTGWPAQRIDRWLYAFDRCEIDPTDLCGFK